MVLKYPKNCGLQVTLILSLKNSESANVLSRLRIIYHSTFFVQVGHKTTYICSYKKSSFFHYNMSSSDLPKLLRTVVRGNFNIHGTKNFQDAVFHQKSKIYDFSSILNLQLRFLSPFLMKKKIFEKKKNRGKNFDFDIFQFFFAPMGSGVSGIDTSNN